MMDVDYSLLLCRNSDQKTFEFSYIVNFMLRRDDPDAARHLAKYVATVNLTLVKTRGQMLQPVGQQLDRKVYRGGGMPHEHFGFFTVGKKYRVPGFLATSSDETVARQFMIRANQLRNEPCILWTITVEKDCMHVNYVAKTHVNTEAEYLFAPYSPFKVVKVRYMSCCCFSQP